MTRTDKGLASIFNELVRQGEELDAEIKIKEQHKANLEADLVSLRKLRSANLQNRETVQSESRARDAAEIASQYQHTGRMQ